MQVTFPHLPGLRRSEFSLIGLSQEPQESISGVDTTIPTMRGRWAGSLTLILHNEAASLQWSAFLAQMQGRIGTTLVPVFDKYLPRDANGQRVPFFTIANLRDAQTMEHFGFVNSESVHVVVNRAAALRATEIEVRYPDTLGLRPGHLFSIADRLHRVRYVDLSRETETGPRYSVHFDPPLREAVAAGAVVNINRPVCRMRLVNEDAGAIPHDYEGLYPTVQVQFREAL
ncbi:hypothetical protein [Paracoccus aestuariivivens]|uniref:Uncharacterized protein n=1 Tax=Paracoccus aestuariivivens TaxID=1820333 RepID=A0A6L6J310_9RHOB|nr:hypothetical protein [Paracoccus aestuariivivens]MTH76310.1 hypothetical protein [Paracoccus aestuariivivens]